MSLASQISTVVTRMGTESKSLRTLINGNAADLSALTTTAKGNLVVAINEIRALAASAGPGTLTGLSDVTITAIADRDFLAWDTTTSKWTNRHTSVYGLSLVNIASATALTATLDLSTAALPGIIELATQGEVNTGTDAVRAVTPATLSTYVAAGYQPLDADLTNIAALTTTAYGRAFLTLANQAALVALIPTSTTGAVGLVQLATTLETTTGTDTAKATTSAGTKAAIDQRIDNTAGIASGSTTNAPSVAATKAYVDGVLDANNAYQYKGVIDCSTNPNYPAASAGWTYKVSVAGKIGGASGPNVEVGDSLTCLVDSTASGTQATVGANWIITQTNIDGAVVGPASSVAGNIVSFSGTTGKVVQDTGVAISTDGALTSNSNAKVPTEQAVKTYAQPLDATLTALAGVVTAANKLIYATGVDAFATTDLTAFARTLLDDVDVATAQGTLQVYSQTQVGDPTTDFVAVFNAALV